MAQRRMFSKQVVNTDGFLDLPLSAQALYFQLGLDADDDGFLNNAKSIKRYIGASDDDLKLLVVKGYLIPFKDGAIVIRHWKINNQIRKDRYTPTRYKDDFQQLEEKDQVYNLPTSPTLATIGIPDGNQMATNGIPNGNHQKEPKKLASLDSQGVKAMATKWQPNGNQTATQCSVGKFSSVKASLGKGHTYGHEQGNTSTAPNEQQNIYFQVIDYLNRKYSLRLNPYLIPTKKIIDARIQDGYTLDDFKELIDNLDNVVNWNNEDQKAQVLRPKLLFTKDRFNKLVDGKQDKPQDPFYPNNNEQKFDTEQQVNGVIKYINKIYESDSNKLNPDDKSTRNIIRKAIELDFGNDDKALINHLKDIHGEYDTIDGLIDDLQSGLPF